MDMLSASSISSVFVKASYSLRYELTFALVLLGIWCVAQLARISKKSKHAKLASHSAKRQAPPPTKVGGSGVFKADPPPRYDAKVGVGRIDDIDPALLCEPSWLVPHVTQLCRTQVRQSLALYRAAIEAGLKLREMPGADVQEMFSAMVTSAIRASHMDDMMQILQDIRQHGPGVCPELFSSVAKLCTSKHLFAECLAVYDFMIEEPSFKLEDRSVWSCLLFCAIETRNYTRCSHLFDGLKGCGIPSHKDYGNMVRLASLQGDWKLSLKLLQEMREASTAVNQAGKPIVEIDSVIYNTSLATCAAAGQVEEARALLEEMERTEGLADAITYNTLMKGYAKTGRMEQCFEVFQRLKLQSVAPSQVTYGILLDGFINENQLERAADIFNTMISEGFALNTVLFTTLIKGFARAGDVDQAMNVYKQMHGERSVTPDLITFSILIKANCDADRLEEALQLLEVMTQLKLRPDEVVFNNLLSGCTRQANVKLGKCLYADMIKSGIRPSNATFSIMIRFFHECKLLEEAVDMLRNEPSKHKVDPEPRLFLQLIQSCIRERQGRRAVEAYEMFVERSLPSSASHSSILATCVKLNMFDTAAEILAIAATRGFRVDSRDANALLNAAVRKKKTQVAQDIAAAMVKLGIHIDR